MKKFYSLFLVLLMMITAQSQKRSWNGGNGSWKDITNWTPAGTPLASDILEFNAVSGTISNVPDLTFRGIIVSGSNIIMNGAGTDTKTLTIGNTSIKTAFIINAGASLTIGNNLNIALAKNTIASIDGTLIVATNRNYYTNSGGTTKTIVSGVLRNNGGNVLSAVHQLKFDNGGIYEHARDKGTIPAATWDKNSTCSVTGIVTRAPDGLDQVFGNYKWDCPHQIAGETLGTAIPAKIRGALLIDKTGTGADPAVYLSFPATVIIDGTFLLNSGTCSVKGSNTTIDIAGDIKISGGSLKTSAASSSAGININFVGNKKQLFIKTGGTTNIKSYTIHNHAILDLGVNVLDGDADFTVEEDGQLMTAHPAGIALTGPTGAIQVTGKRTFSSKAGYAYTGSGSQITGTGLPPEVRRLIIDNSSGLIQGKGVTLTKATTVGSELVLNNGFLQTTNNNILTIAAGGGATVSDSSFVAGPLRKTGNTSFTFPTGWAGSGGGRIPIGISSMEVAATIQAEYKRAQATNKGTTINAPLHHISYCEYWELFPTTGSTTTNVTMYRNAHSNCNPVSYSDDFSSVRVARSNGTAWTQVGNTLDSLDAGNGHAVLSDSAITISVQEKYFALGNITTAKDPLPVMFDNVKAFEKNSGVNIEWSNLTERDIAVYYVERSVNGIDYSIIGQYLPKNNRDDKASYTHIDESPVPGENFYRIKVIVKNTKIIFSKVMRIETGMPYQKLSLYPNPVISKQFNLSLAGITEGKYLLRVISITGREIYQCKINNTGAFTTQMIKLPSSVKPGVYNLVIAGSDFQENKMIIVQ